MLEDIKVQLINLQQDMQDTINSIALANADGVDHASLLGEIESFSQKISEILLDFPENSV